MARAAFAVIVQSGTSERLARSTEGRPRSSRTALDASGGAGNRTPVRDKICHSVYVRSSPVWVSSRWPMSRRRLDKSPKVSPAAGRRDAGLSRIFDTHKTASGGLPYGQVQ